MRNAAYRIVVGKPYGIRQLGRPKVAGRIIFKMVLKGIGCELVD
jgi:hypothetical protein